MQTECFLLADSASDYQGKLCVLGAFDTIYAHHMPCTHPHSVVAVRIRFEQLEDGLHKVRLRLIDEDGQIAGPDINVDATVTTQANSPSSVLNLVLAMNNLNFKKFGAFHFDLVVDGQLRARLPLYVVQIQQMRKAA